MSTLCQSPRNYERNLRRWKATLQAIHGLCDIRREGAGVVGSVSPYLRRALELTYLVFDKSSAAMERTDEYIQMHLRGSAKPQDTYTPWREYAPLTGSVALLLAEREAAMPELRQLCSEARAQQAPEAELMEQLLDIMDDCATVPEHIDEVQEKCRQLVHYTKAVEEHGAKQGTITTQTASQSSQTPSLAAAASQTPSTY
jgi:hypothetical protein